MDFASGNPVSNKPIIVDENMKNIALTSGGQQ